MISEWYAKGHDEPGLSNESGAGWLVKTEPEYAPIVKQLAGGLPRFEMLPYGRGKNKGEK